MRALVVFESMFGNTQAIANAVADGLASRMSVEVVEVGVAPKVIGDDVGLLVVGGPTHAFGLTRPNTRQSAVPAGRRSRSGYRPDRLALRRAGSRGTATAVEVSFETGQS